MTSSVILHISFLDRTRLTGHQVRIFCAPFNAGVTGPHGHAQLFSRAWGFELWSSIIHTTFSSSPKLEE